MGPPTNQSSRYWIPDINLSSSYPQSLCSCSAHPPDAQATRAHPLTNPDTSGSPANVWCADVEKSWPSQQKPPLQNTLRVSIPLNYFWLTNWWWALTLVLYKRCYYFKHSVHFHLLTSSVDIDPTSNPKHSGWYKALHDPVHIIVCLLGSNSSAQVQSLEQSATTKSQCLQYHSSSDAKSLSKPVHSKWNQFEHLSHCTIGFWISLFCLQ